MSSYTIYVDAIFAFVLAQLKKGAVTYIISIIPFLAWGPLAPILSFVIGKIIDRGAVEGKIRVFFEKCDIRCSSQAIDFFNLALVWHNNQTLENEKAAIDAFKKLGSFVL